MERAELKPRIEEIKELKVVQNWIEGLRENSRKNYLNALAEFCNVIDKTPDEILTIAFQEQRDRVPPWEQQIEDWFKAYKNYFYEKPDCSKTTSTVRRNIVSNFFHFYKLVTPTDSTRREKDRLSIPNEREGLTKKELTEAIEQAKQIKIKALLLTQATSGLAISDVLKITIKQFKDGLIQLDDERQICRIHQKRTKTSREHYTFISFEAVEMIQKYLKRERGKYQLKWPLFASERNSEKQYSTKGYQTALSRLNEMLGWSTDKWKFNKLTSHMLRKFFETQLTDAGMINDHLIHLMGWKHKDSLKATYYLAHPDELERSYIKHLDYLTLENLETLTIESKEYKELKEQYKKDSQEKDEEIKGIKEALKAKDEEIAAIYDILNDPEFKNLKKTKN